MDYKEKLKQTNKEALVAVISLVLVIIVWALSGFGVAATGIVVFSTPLWVVTGCFGTFLFTVLLTVVMARYVMKDVGLDEGEGDDDAR